MKPFVLRRLKREVLKDLPKKTDATLLCPLEPAQREKYDDLIQTFSQQGTQAVINKPVVTTVVVILLFQFIVFACKEIVTCCLQTGQFVCVHGLL
jgi:hypothetical protein